MEQKTLLHCVTTNFDTLIEQAFDYQQTRRLKVLCDDWNTTSANILLQ